jgi:hypothetical protein
MTQNTASGHIGGGGQHTGLLFSINTIKIFEEQAPIQNFFVVVVNNKVQ